MTKALIAYTRRLVAFSASDVVEFGLVVTLLIIVYGGLELPIAAAVGVGIGGWLLSPVAPRAHQDDEQWLEHTGAVDIVPEGFDSLDF